MGKILRYIFVFLLISPLAVSGQSRKDEWRIEGPRIGVDISRLLMPYIQRATVSGFELQADMPYKGNFFPTVEAGYLSVNDQQESFHYSNKGPYARIGVDVNISKFESLGDDDLVFVGARYGFSHFVQETLNASYTNYWGTLQAAFPAEGMNAHWGELVFGLKGELLPNFFFGWSVRAKFLFASSKGTHVDPYVIPGLGYNRSEVPFDFSLTVAYRIPLKKTKTLPKPLKSKATQQDPDEEEDPNNPNYNQRGNTNNYGTGQGGMNRQF